MSVKFGELVRGNWVATSDTQEYVITAEVQITGDKKVNNIVNGRIAKDEVTIGAFHQSGTTTIPSFTPQTSDAVVAISAYQAVIDFAAAVASEAIENPPFNA